MSQDQYPSGSVVFLVFIVGDRRSKEDQVQQISTSIYVTNFPEQFSFRDLWKECQEYGRVIDAYIPNRRSKSSNRFGFVRFIHIKDVDRLVRNLCTIWMGHLRLHANVAKFQRLPLNKTQYVKGANDGCKFSGEVPSNSKGFSMDQSSYVGAVKQKMEHKQVVEEDSKPSLVLDESCFLEYDYSLALKGKVSDFGLLTNLKMVLIKEGFDNFNLKYLGGFWVLIEFRMKEVLENFKSHVGVGSWFSSLEYASNSFVIDERVVWVDIEGVPMKMWTSNTFNKILSKWEELLFEEDKENLSLYKVSGWVPNFLEEEEGEGESDDDKVDNEFVGDKNEDELQAHSDNDCDIDAVPETKFSQSHETSKQGNETRFEEGEIHSEDPFKIYDLLQNKPCSNNKEEENSNATLKYPPGFTPLDDLSNKDDQDVFVNVEEQVPKQLINAQGNVNEDNCNRGVSQSKEEDKESHCSGHFKRPTGPQTGGSILQVLDDLVKVGQTMGYKMDGYYFVAIQGDWIPNAKRYLIISVYAPQEFSEKRMLWSYLNHVIDSWSDLMGSCPNITAITLDRYSSDHRPVLLREVCYDYGPISFRMFHYWFEWEGFDKFIVDTWSNTEISDNNDILKFIKKLRYLKVQTRLWVRDKKESVNVNKSNLKGMLHDIDLLVDDKKMDPELLNKRVHVMNSIQELEKLEATELAQKAKINWSIEGDENSKYFHGVLNKKRNQHAIRGILTKGIWIEDPNSVKDEFLSHFQELFDSPCSSRLTLDMVFPNRISAEQNLDLERNVTKEEIKRAVWDCGTDKSLDRMALHLDFIEDIGILSKKMSSMRCLISSQQARFLKEKKETMIFKVDFEKAYDSVRWDYLEDVLNKFGFGSKWRDWILNCLHSSKGSILVNGSPTGEFQFRKGLKEGDPLSPFLFLLIMESLHLSFQNVVNEGLFKGVSVSSSSHLSHLFYADDVIFMGKWSESNINTIVQALDCFYKDSGLRMNLHKSKLMGITVDDELVSRDAIKMGCSTLKTPFLYLGIKVGGLMSRIRFIRALHGNGGGIDMRSKVSYSSTWMSIVNEFNKLRNNDIDLLSFLNKRVGNGLDTNFWEDVWLGDKNFKTRFPRIYALESDKKLTVATKMNHNDVGFSLRRLPRDGVEMEQFRALTSVLEGVELPDMNDRWFWSLVGSDEFSVASARKFIEDHRLLGSPHKTGWIKVVPIKINIMAWKVRFNFLPTRLNLSRRGIEIQSIICPICNKEVESTSRVFFACSLVRDIYQKIATWWELTYSEFQSYEEWFAWFLSLRMSSKHKGMLEGIFLCYMVACVGTSPFSIQRVHQR
ncbi:RNA-directed DNA polymerase, eukaryota [Tanacetum coccineum]